MLRNFAEDRVTIIRQCEPQRICESPLVTMLRNFLRPEFCKHRSTSNLPYRRNIKTNMVTIRILDQLKL